MHVPNSVLTVKRCLQGEGASRCGGWRWSLQGRCDINIYAQIFLNFKHYTNNIFCHCAECSVGGVGGHCPGGVTLLSAG